MKPVWALLLAALALPAQAQDRAEGLALATRAELRGLDKIAGTSTDISVSLGETVDFGQITVELKQCRYPADDPASNAFAYVVIREKRDGAFDFEGWLIADSPALSALDHPRYDIWVIRCISN